MEKEVMENTGPRPHEMLFAEFAEAVRPTTALNRFPQIGQADEVLTYTVYLNGPVADQLPVDAREQTFKDVMVLALTDKLGLNPGSFRDNAKVAELVGVRSMWMSAVLEASADIREGKAPLSDEVVADYERLTRGLSHPYIVAQLKEQLEAGKKVAPVLEAAKKVVQEAVETPPKDVNQGVIVAQDLDFTVQHVGGAEVVAHENRRLDEVPTIGDDVTVAYYRGMGQVFTNSKDLTVSAPFLDRDSGRLGVTIGSASDEQQKTILFNGVASFSKFVEALNLPRAMVEEALTLHANRDRGQPAKEAGPPTDRDGVAELVPVVVDAARNHGIEVDPVKVGLLLTSGRVPDGEQFVGKVVAVDQDVGLVFQSTGRGAGMVHLAGNLSQVPQVGEVASIKYQNNRGQVQTREQGQDKGNGR